MSCSKLKISTTPGTLLTRLLGITLGAGIALSAQAQLDLEGFWIRAMPPGQPMTAGYGKITNSSAGPATILGASVTFADKVEFHETVTVDGAMRMQPIQNLTLEAGESLTLTPVGSHLIIICFAAMPNECSYLSLFFQTFS